MRLCLVSGELGRRQEGSGYSEQKKASGCQLCTAQNSIRHMPVISIISLSRIRRDLRDFINNAFLLHRCSFVQLCTFSFIMVV